MAIFLVANTHFNHNNIIEYCKRPFHNTFEMNNSIIEKWNEVVSEDDIVYHLGDVGFGSLEEITALCNRLNGKKYLIMGNHDYRYGKLFFEKAGFEDVEKKEMKIGNIILTHHARPVEKGYINIYGHIHDIPVAAEFDDDKHYCVSLERTEYYPVKLDSIIKDI